MSGFRPGRPEKLPLQSFGVDPLPVEFCLVRPALVDSWIYIVPKGCVQIVIASSFLQIHFKLQFSDAFFKSHFLLVRLDFLCLQLVQSLLFFEEGSFPGLWWRTFVIASDRSLKIRYTSVMQFDE